MKKMGLSTWMIIALILGIIIGAACNSMGIDTAPIKPLGDIFISLVKMLVVPLLMASIISGTSSMNNMKKLGRVAVKAIILYVATMCLAMILGIVVANVIQPGVGVQLAGGDAAVYEGKEFPGFLQTILNMVPSNVVASMAAGDLLPLILFSVFFGFCINAAGDKGRLVADFVASFAEIMYKMTGYVMMYAPVGAFALICYTVGNYGLSVVLPLGKMIITVYATLIAFVLLIYVPMLKGFCGINAPRFLKAMQEPLLIAFSTTSSMAALPSNMRASQELGLSKDVSSFLIPLGNTVNMAGAAMYIAIVSNFVAQAYGMPLSIGQQINVVITALLISIGAVGIPGYMIVMMTSVFTTVGIPLDGVSLVAGVDKILDMARTPCNIIGDVAIALVVDKSEKKKEKNNNGIHSS